MRKMFRWINKTKTHLPYILIIILLVLIVFGSFMFHYDEMQGVAYNDAWTFYRTKMEITKISIEKYKDFIPLWNPYTMSGAPLFAKPGSDIGFFYINYPLLMVFPLTLALKLSYVLSVILAGISMYSLMVYLKLEKKFALISATVYMFNGWLFTRFRWGHLTTISPHAITPLIILFVIKAFKEKEWIKNSIITGILFAIHIHAGPDLKVTLWVIPIVVLYALFRVIGNLGLNQLKKAIAIGIIIALVTFGLTAIKVLPAKEYLEIGSRAGIDFNRARSQRVEWKNIFFDLIEPIPPKIQNPGGHYNVGIIAFLLAGFALFKKYKNKMVLYFTSIVILSIFLGTGSFLFYLFWRYVPYYGSFRYPSRILSIYVFAMAALAGLGASLFAKRLKEKYNWEAKKINIVFICLMILILVNNVVFGVVPHLSGEWINPDEALAENEILQYLSKQPGIFRMHTYENMGIDWMIEFQYIPLGLQCLYGYDAAWLVDYMNVYLSVAFNNPAKFWGILNTKYVTSQSELNITGLKFLEKFNECKGCLLDVGKYGKVYGPYLYENEMFLPRAYIVPNSILVVGKKENVMQLIYGLMLDDKFDPSKTVIIQGKENIDQHAVDELKRYNTIFLTGGSVDQNSAYKLTNYIENGGILIPDITKGEQEISMEKIRGMWNSFKGSIGPIDDIDHEFVNFDQRRLKINGKEGFLVYSEILTHYPGWTAEADGEEKDIQRADGLIGTIYLDSPTEEVILKFKPKSFRNGSIITFVTIPIIFTYFIYRKFKRSNKKKNIDLNQEQPQSP